MRINIITCIYVYAFDHYITFCDTGKNPKLRYIHVQYNFISAGMYFIKTDLYISRISIIKAVISCISIITAVTSCISLQHVYHVFHNGG